MRRLFSHSLLCMLTAFAAAFMLQSCNNDNCIGNSTGIPLAGFYHDGATVSVTNLTVYGIGAPNDSVIIDKTTASKVYMPFRLSTSDCQYVLNYNIEDVKNDTITFNYQAIPYFESHECGAMYNFKITSCEHTTHAIDSIIIPNPMITNADIVSIKIYMR